MTDLAAAEDAYEQAEAGYLAGIRSGADRMEMTGLALTLARAAGEWNTVAYRAFHAAGALTREGLDLVTERTEVLSELWADVLDAYRGLMPFRNGMRWTFASTSERDLQPS